MSITSICQLFILAPLTSEISGASNSCAPRCEISSFRLPTASTGIGFLSYTSVFLYRYVVAGPHRWCLFLDVLGIRKEVAIPILVPSITFLEKLHYIDIFFQNKAPCFGGSWIVTDREWPSISGFRSW